MRRGANPAGAVLALGVRSGELLGARSAPVLLLGDASPSGRDSPPGREPLASFLEFG